MPLIRFIGNVCLTQIFRFVSSNFHLKDITNGLIGIKVVFLKKLNLSNIRNDYFFEQDLLYRIVANKGNIFQVKTKIIYENEKSNLKPLKTILPFLFFHLKNLIFRIK